LACDHACRPTRSFRDGLEHVGDLKADLERGFAAWVGPELAKNAVRSISASARQAETFARKFATIASS
jgi:hypothetical protein